MTNIIKHVWDHILHFKWAYLVIGCVAIVVAVVAGSGKKAGPATSPSSGSEGTTVTMGYSGTAPAPEAVTAVFTDPGEHGYYAVQSGGGTYMAYDPSKGLTYKTPATKNADGTYSFTTPSGMCGFIVQSSEEPNLPPKKLTVTLAGPDGKPLPGAEPRTFDLKCDKYTLNIKITSSKDPVLPDGADQATITATLSVKGPAQFVNGKRVNPSAPKIMIVSPLGLVMTNFTTDLGAMVPPSPANIKTDKAGQAIVTLTSSEAGIANVRATALGIGDASVKVHFPPKITGVKEDFVPPQSPTNYQISTIPKDGSKLTYDWKFIPAPGASCGRLTGPASGLGASKNGFYHGPSDGFPNGCDEKWELASQVQVTVTDKDGQSDTKTFGARAFEGQGVVKL